MRGTVISLHLYGATLRLETGELASAPQSDVQAHRLEYERAFWGRKELAFDVRRSGTRHPVALLAPNLRDAQFEDQIAHYLKTTQEWERPEDSERHFLRKKRRAALFESKHADDR